MIPGIAFLMGKWFSGVKGVGQILKGGQILTIKEYETKDDGLRIKIPISTPAPKK